MLSIFRSDDKGIKVRAKRDKRYKIDSRDEWPRTGRRAAYGNIISEVFKLQLIRAAYRRKSCPRSFVQRFLKRGKSAEISICGACSIRGAHGIILLQRWL